MNLGWIFIVIAAIIWSIDGVLLTPRYFKYGFYNVPMIVFISHFIPLVILFFMNRFYLYKIKTIKRKYIVTLILISLFGGCLGTLSIVKSLELTSFSPISVVILIQKLQPIFAIISAYFILNERFDNNFKYVFIISLLCLYILTFGLKNPLSLEYKSFLASFYSLIAAISFGISTTFSRKIALNIEFKVAVFFRYFFTTIISFLILLIMPFRTLSSLNLLLNFNIMVLSLIISVLSIISLNLYYIGLKTTKAIYSTICELAFPITAVFLDILINKSVLEGSKIFAAFILIISITYLNIKTRKY